MVLSHVFVSVKVLRRKCKQKSFFPKGGGEGGGSPTKLFIFCLSCTYNRSLITFFDRLHLNYQHFIHRLSIFGEELTEYKLGINRFL